MNSALSVERYSVGIQNSNLFKGVYIHKFAYDSSFLESMTKKENNAEGKGEVNRKCQLFGTPLLRDRLSVEIMFRLRVSYYLAVQIEIHGRLR